MSGSNSTSVPTISFTPAGYVVPLQSAIVLGLTNDWNSALGGSLNPSPQTPQGQIIASEAAILGDCNDQLVALFNSFNPYYASGRMQDALGAIYFLTRLPAQSTVLEIVCGGVAGVVIPANALIQDSASNQYYNTNQVTIGPTGTIVATFAADNTGPIAVPATVKILQGTAQWNTATVQSGIIGTNVESRASFEARREASVASNGAGFLPTITGTVLSVPGVVDAYVTENYQNTPQPVQGVTLNANSLYVCVAGGSQLAVAQAIWSKKPPGCSYTGNTTVTVYDDSPGYSEPFPSYQVTFELPVGAAISFNVVMQSNAQVPSNALTLIQAAIQQSFDGEDSFGTQQATIASTIVSDDYVSNIRALGPWARVYSIGIGCSQSPTVSFSGTIAGTTLTAVSLVGTISVGQFVYGAGVVPGTIILSGAGSSWTVSTSQTVATEPMTAVTANNRFIQMNLNYLPTLINSADINLTLM